MPIRSAAIARLKYFYEKTKVIRIENRVTLHNKQTDGQSNIKGFRDETLHEKLIVASSVDTQK